MKRGVCLECTELTVLGGDRRTLVGGLTDIVHAADPVCNKNLSSSIALLDRAQAISSHITLIFHLRSTIERAPLNNFVPICKINQTSLMPATAINRLDIYNPRLFRCKAIKDNKIIFIAFGGGGGGGCCCCYRTVDPWSNCMIQPGCCSFRASSSLWLFVCLFVGSLFDWKSWCESSLCESKQ